ncbi:MAG: hypothetical protein K6A43_05655 [Treponema sp.]|nr:hypothetical protein [Treponema sp.]
MQICKKNGFCSVIAFLILFFVCDGSFLFAQTIKMPEMPTMPEMPKMGDSFYHPTFPGKSVAPAEKSGTKEENEKKEPVLTNGQTTEEYLAEILKRNNLLSAQDISNLYDSGSFGTLSSLVGGNSLSQTSSTDILLRQMLTSLDDLKKTQNQSSDAEKQKLQLQQQDSETFKDRTPSVLRFKINGYDISDSLTKIFFSEPEPDGSFLFTADRKYFVNKRPRTETFYILFKSVKSNGSSTTYNLTTTLSQDEKNENSYIYKLAQQKNLTAEKTGNLVVLHNSQNDFKMDLLLDIDCAR